MTKIGYIVFPGVYIRIRSPEIQDTVGYAEENEGERTVLEAAPI